jgi:hypothetical protein
MSTRNWSHLLFGYFLISTNCFTLPYFTHKLSHRFMAEHCRRNRITSFSIYGQGTMCDWKQPVGYFFVNHATSAERLKKLAFCCWKADCSWWNYSGSCVRSIRCQYLTLHLIGCQYIKAILLSLVIRRCSVLALIYLSFHWLFIWHSYVNFIF